MGTYRFTSYFPCEGCSPDGSLKLVSLTEFCKSHYISRFQAMRLFRLKVLVGKKFKGKIWCNWNPSMDEGLRDVNLYIGGRGRARG